MFGFTCVWSGRVRDRDPQSYKHRELSFSYERRDNVVWLSLSLWWWAFQWRRLDGVTRETGPEENRSVLSYFFGHFRPRQRKDRGFSEAFDRSSTKPILTRAEIEQRNRAAVASGKFTPLTLVDGGVRADPRFSR